MTEFAVQCRVAAPMEVVWRAWTTPGGLASWWWPQLRDTTYDIDARVGGSYRFESKAAGIGAQGEFTAVEQPGRLDMTWWWIGGDTPTQPDFVSVDLQSDQAATQVTVTHRTPHPDDSCDDLRVGWNDVLKRLATTLVKPNS